MFGWKLAAAMTMMETVATTVRGIMRSGPSHDNNDFQQAVY